MPGVAGGAGEDGAEAERVLAAIPSGKILRTAKPRPPTLRCTLPPAICEEAMTKITACWSKSADWRSEIKLTLDSLGFLRPDSNTGRPRKRRRDMDIPGSADPMAMGDALIAAVLGHRNTPGRYGLGGQVEFLCEVRAPPQARIECLLALSDHNLRAAIARGDDLICMPKAWWSYALIASPSAESGDGGTGPAASDGESPMQVRRSWMVLASGKFQVINSLTFGALGRPRCGDA